MSFTVSPSHRMKPAQHMLAMVDQRSREIVSDEDGPLMFFSITDANEALAWARQEWPGRVLALQVVLPLLYPTTVTPE